MSRILLRGRAYAATLSNIGVEKYFVVVSNNQRNRALDSVLAVRVTTSAKPALPSIVELGPADPLVGRVVCDDIVELYADEVSRELGALSPRTMDRLGDGLRAALALP